MPKKATLVEIANSTNAISAINTELAKVNDQFENTISRDGSTPNEMNADLDLNSNSLLNGGVINADSLILSGVSVTALGTVFDYRGAWQTATAYGVNDVVLQGGSSYLCLIAHTSGSFSVDLAASRWGQLAQKGSDGVDGTDGADAPVLSDADIKTQYENNADTNAFTDAEQAKLSGIETSADVTDSANVVSSLDSASPAIVTATDSDYVLIKDTSDSSTLKRALKTDFGGFWQNVSSGVQIPTSDVGSVTFTDSEIATANALRFTAAFTVTDTLTSGDDIEIQIREAAGTWRTVVRLQLNTVGVDENSGDKFMFLSGELRNLGGGVAPASGVFGMVSYNIVSDGVNSRVLDSTDAENTLSTNNGAQNNFQEAVVGGWSSYSFVPAEFRIDTVGFNMEFSNSAQRGFIQLEYV